MSTKSKLFVSQTHKTKTWWMFLSVLLFVFVPLLIVWLLVGEFNLLGNDWLIAKNASVWHGAITEETDINALASAYAKFWDPANQQTLAEALTEKIGHTISIDSYKTFFNPILLAPLLGLLVWSIIWPITFNATKISGLDVLPFSFAVALLLVGMIASGLILQWGQKMMPVYWLTRLFACAIIGVIAFLIVNYFTNKYMASKPYAVDVFFGYKKIDSINAPAKQLLKENLDTFNKQKEQEQDFVEVEEDK